MLIDCVYYRLSFLMLHSTEYFFNAVVPGTYIIPVTAVIERAFIREREIRFLTYPVII